MGINRFNRPVNNQLISQFVPQNLNMIAKVLAGKQQRYDIEANKMEILQDEVSSLSSVGQIDSNIVKQSGLNLDAIANEYSNKDLADPRIAKELRSKAKAISSDPLLKNTQQSVRAMKQYQEDKRKIKMYRPENDDFADQLAAYQQQGGAANGPLRYTGIIEGVDEYKAAEEYFDDIPASGRSSWIMIDDKIKEVGWEGIREDQIQGQVAQSVNSFGQSEAGQQALRRYRKLEQAGRLSEDASPGKYLAGILLNAGRERIGEKRTNVGSGFQRDASGGFTSSSTERTSVQFTPPAAKNLRGADYDEAGNLVGSGNISFVDVFMTDATLKEKIADESLNPEEAKQWREVIKLAKDQDISQKEAASIIEQRVSPAYNQLYGKRQKDITTAFMDKNAGFYNTMTVLDDDGNEWLATDIFEEMGVLDSDGNFDVDKDKVSSVLVNGVFGPKSGLAPKGLEVSIGSKHFIFIDRNPNFDEVEAYMNNQLNLLNVATVPDYIQFGKNYDLPAGTTLTRDKNNKTTEYEPLNNN